MPVSLGGVGCLSVDVLAREGFLAGLPQSRQPHSYECPLGPAPGDAWLAMSLSALRSLDSILTFAGTYDLTFRSDNLSGPTAAPVVIKHLSITGAECLAPGARSDDAPYLVRLADPRLTDNRRLVDRGYNLRDVRVGNLITSSLNAGVAWTWQQALADLWAAAGLGVAPTLVPETGMPEGTPENLEYWQTPALDALEDFLARLSCNLAYDPLQATYGVVETGAADPAHVAFLARWARWRIDDAYPVIPVATQRPAYCRVLFPRLPHVVGNGTPWYAIDVPDPLGQGRAGTYATLTDDEAALVPAGTVVTNLTALTSRAAARAADFFASISAADRLRTAYPLPLSDVVPGRRVERVRWSLTAAGGMQTEVAHQRMADRTQRSPLSIPPDCCGAPPTISYEQTATVSSGPWGVNLPDVPTGALWLIAATAMTNVGGGVTQFSTPPGWTVVSQRDYASGTGNAVVVARIRQPGDASLVSGDFSSSDAGRFFFSAVALGMQGCAIPSVVNSAEGADAAPTVTTITPTAEPTLLLFLPTYGEIAFTPFTPPSGMSEIIPVPPGGTLWRPCFQVLPSQAATGSRVAAGVGSGALWCAFLVSVPYGGGLVDWGRIVNTSSSGYALTSGTLAQFAATTSAQLAGVISDETGTGGLVFATSPALVTPALGTPASGVLTNCTGTAAGLTAGNVTTNANLTGPITSTGNATSIASQTGTGTTFAMSVSPALTGTPTAPTATAGTNTTQLATTAFVTTAVAGVGSGFLLAANNLSDVASVITSRSNLGLGTAATRNTGTSGGTVPLLDGSNFWSSLQAFGASGYSILSSASGALIVVTNGSYTGSRTLTLTGPDSNYNLTLTGSSASLTGTNSGDTTVTGTANRITVTGGGGATPTVDVHASYAGQSSITTLGTVTTGTWSATAIAETKGGTNQTSYTLGDVLYASAANTLSKLAGNTTSTKKYLQQTGTGTVSAAPAWGPIAAADVPVFVAAGGSHAVGAVPDPGATAHTNQPYYLGDDSTFHRPYGLILGTPNFTSTSETTTSTSAADLTTVQSVTFSVDETSNVWVSVGATHSNNTATAINRLHVTVDGSATTVSQFVCTGANQNFNMANGYYATGLTVAGNPHTIKVQFSVNAGTGTFSNRSISVERAP